jgi:hypothetical protein
MPFSTFLAVSCRFVSVAAISCLFHPESARRSVLSRLWAFCCAARGLDARALELGSSLTQLGAPVSLAGISCTQDCPCLSDAILRKIWACGDSR